MLLGITRSDGPKSVRPAYLRLLKQYNKPERDPAGFKRLREALARAEALFGELTGESRQLLAGALANLRAALETQDEAAIEAQRERLVALIERLRRA